MIPPMNPLLLSSLLLLGCVSAAPEEPKPAPAKEEPKPVPKEEPKPEEPKPAPPKEEPKPDPPKEEPKPEPKKEEAPPAPPPPPPKTSPEAKDLLVKAARRQGTDGLVGGLAPTRFQAAFATVLVYSEGGDKHEFIDSTESFALPAPGGKEARMRSSVVAGGVWTVLGHNGRFGWMWTRDMKTSEEQVKRFTDREKDAEDIKDVDSRRVMDRLGLRVFFLGAMAEAPIPVALLPDEERAIPVGREGKARAVKCRVLERAADAASGEPALRIYLEEKTLDPVAIALLPPKEGEASFLLTLDFDEEAIRAKKGYPKGLRVPDWLELFEIPADPKEGPALRIQAGFKSFEIDPAKVPDALFEAPRGK